MRQEWKSREIANLLIDGEMRRVQFDRDGVMTDTATGTQLCDSNGTPIPPLLSIYLQLRFLGPFSTSDERPRSLKLQQEVSFRRFPMPNMPADHKLQTMRPRSRTVRRARTTPQKVWSSPPRENPSSQAAKENGLPTTSKMTRHGSVPKPHLPKVIPKISQQESRTLKVPRKMLLKRMPWGCVDEVEADLPPNSFPCKHQLI